MLKIRLTRRGKRNRPFFRIVVAEAAAPIQGRFIEILGHVDPLAKKRTMKKERVLYWLSQGAQPSPTVHNILVTEGIIKGAKVNKFVAPKKKKQTDTAVAPVGQEKQRGSENKDQATAKTEKAAPEKTPPTSEQKAKKAPEPKEQAITEKPQVKAEGAEEKVKPLPTETTEKTQK